MSVDWTVASQQDRHMFRVALDPDSLPVETGEDVKSIDLVFVKGTQPGALRRDDYGCIFFTNGSRPFIYRRDFPGWMEDIAKDLDPFTQEDIP